ncbi:MAG: hypothetical protein J07HB67_00175 [halophilic archaeon J07HB67]|jgi:hypothetical protein|nr:MAG: hypothetical protein J07HB67_00175 [halophilic archaeon J07HB67]
MRARIEEVRASLATEGVASAAQLQQLLRVVTEALVDVRAARVVAALPERDLSQAVPGAPDTGGRYEVTATEQRKSTNILLNLLFTVVETPTHADRRVGDDRDADSDDTDHEGGHTLGVEAYAGPE